MRVWVSVLYQPGRPLAAATAIVPIPGDLVLLDKPREALGRTVRCAGLRAVGTAANILDPLTDVHLVGVDAHGFVLRGIEYLDHAQVAQEWRVRVTAPDPGA